MAYFGGINSEATHTNTNNLPSYDLDVNYKATETPIKYETSLENLGIAVFRGDRLVGELNAIETMCYLIITNKLNSATISIPSPFNQNKTIALSITYNKKPKNSAEIINNSPYIKTEISINATILSIDENIDYLDETNLNLIQDYANTYLKNNISSYLYKTAKEYKSDITGFGRYTKKYYLTINDWNKLDWLNNYENAFFDVNVKTNIQSSTIFNKM